MLDFGIGVAGEAVGLGDAIEAEEGEVELDGVGGGEAYDEAVDGGGRGAEDRAHGLEEDAAMDVVAAAGGEGVGVEEGGSEGNGLVRGAGGVEAVEKQLGRGTMEDELGADAGK